MSAGQSQATQFDRNIETAERDGEIARYFASHPAATPKDVADHFQISKTAAHQAKWRAINAAAARGGNEYIAAQLVEIHASRAAAWAVLNAHHIVVSDGRVVIDPRDGELLRDSKPVLAALREIRGIAEWEARLLGLNAPARTEVTVTNDGSDVAAELAAFLAGVDTAARGSAGVETGVAPDSPT